MTMNVTRKRRLMALFGCGVGLAVASMFVLYALRQNISLFYTPTQIVSGEAPYEKRIRIGGMVVKDSVQRQIGHLSVQFQLTDYEQTVTVFYQGILPDLFREGQGIVAQGKLSESGVFQAIQVLAKHDENYMPPEVQQSLRRERS